MRLEECLASHEDCQQNDTGIPALPDRVIDVGTTRWRLIDSRGMRKKYIALSHCWGGQIKLKLERKTYDAFRGGLAISKLAKTFQDAMKIARSLGIRYLWIDCLCIIQDSTTDWMEQSKKMASLYSHATLTIYAMASGTSHNGILTPRNSPMIKEMPLAQPVCVSAYRTGTVTDSEAQLELVQEWEEEWEEEWAYLAHMSVLASRGWALQEYVLAPRRLIFGTRRVYWECFRGEQTMDGFTMTRDHYKKFEFNGFRAQIHAHFPRSKSQGQGLLEDYYKLVELYVARQLTKSSDKFPAFSAIAGSVHPAIGGDYIAGLWTADLHRGLLWFCDRPSRHQPLPASYRAPSWSWATSDHKIKFYHDRYPFGGNALPLHESWKISLVDSTNPYGEIQSAQLNLTVWTKRLQFVSSEATIPWHNNSQDGNFFYPDFDVFEESMGFWYKMTNTQRESEIYTVFVNETENWPPRDYLLIALMEKGTGLSDGPGLLCLIIGRASNATSEAYERVGVLETSASRDWQQSWPRQSITLC